MSCPIRVGKGRVSDLRLTQPEGRGAPVVIEIPGDGAGRARAEVRGRGIIEAALRRMLRLDIDLATFHARCRAAGPPFERAPDLGFGRLLRAPSLFEDVVKVLATTNTSWGGTRGMVARLVDLAGVEGAFPSPAEVAALGANRIRGEARWGYRAPHLAGFAQAVAGGALDLSRWESWPGPTAELEREIRAVPGLGPYASAHVLALLGRHDRIGVDTVFRSFVRRRYFPKARRPPADRRLLAVYDAWDEWRSLAYWFDLWYDHYGEGGMLAASGSSSGAPPESQK